jgi:hypothetical protein
MIKYHAAAGKTAFESATARIMCYYARKGLDIHAKIEYYHFDVNVKVVQAL